MLASFVGFVRIGRTFSSELVAPSVGSQIARMGNTSLLRSCQWKARPFGFFYIRPGVVSRGGRVGGVVGHER